MYSNPNLITLGQSQCFYPSSNPGGIHNFTDTIIHLASSTNTLKLRNTLLSSGAFCGVRRSLSGAGQGHCLNHSVCTHVQLSIHIRTPARTRFTHNSALLVPDHFAKQSINSGSGDKQRSYCTGSNPTTHTP